MNAKPISLACALTLLACTPLAIAGPPTQTETSKLIANDRAHEDYFGSSVATSGSLVAVGAIGDNHNGIADVGSVYIFDMTTGQQVTKLYADTLFTDGSFGRDVAFAGNKLLVGAYRDDHSGVLDPGSVYVFDLNTNQQVAKLKANDAARTDAFGIAFAASGTTAVIGASSDSHGSAGPNYQWQAGSAYIFDLTTNQQVAKILPDDIDDEDHFGSSVALSGSIAVIGSPTKINNGIMYAGAAYVFDVTTGEQLFKLTPDDPEDQSYFGSSVAISGSIALVGAPYDDYDNSGNYPSAGSAYLFDITTGQQIAKLTANDPTSYQDFGTSIAVSGTTAIIGGEGYLLHTGDPLTNGAAYIFDLNTHQQIAKLSASNEDRYKFFARSVAISESKAFAGAYYDSHGSYLNAGSVFVFDLPNAACQADLNDDGQLDFFDLSAFLTAYSSADPSVDFNNDGLFDFFDISQYLTLYQAGCP
ncbi:MAG: GC-type dockerin domain-anchored protein [Phycisphaerales bacterium]